MGYKVLGYVVWQGGKWYVRHRFPGAGRKLAIGALGAVAVAAAAGGVAAQRKSGD
jgi:hypothetical protein